MSYHLMPKVHFVEGHKNACFYDMNNLKILHVNEKTKALIRKLLGENNPNLNEPEKKVLGFLVDNDLLRSGEVPKSKEPNIPVFNVELVWIEITRNCNLRCVHCYEDACSDNNSMSYEDFSLVLKEVSSINPRRVMLIGGEPFCHSKIRQMIFDMSACGFSTEIFTNATMLNEESIEILKKCNVKLGISVYSYNESDHENVTKIPGSYARTRDGIKALDKAGIPYHVACVQMKDICLGERTNETYSLDAVAKAPRLSGRAGLKLYSEEMIRAKLITRKTFEKRINEDLFNKLKYGHNCYSTKLYIASDLDVYPCVMERDVKYGNLHDMPLKEILDTRRIIKKDDVDVCKECEYRYQCFDCRSDRMSDSVLDKPWFCTYDPIKGEWADESEFVSAIFARSRDNIRFCRKA